MSNQYTIHDLLDIMQTLRNPDTGCSWDKVQTFQTIAPYTIEEAYEVVDAISRQDMPDLCDELGDLLLQVVYHAQMAKECEEFSFDAVVSAICEKMVRRHPHIFGTDVEIQSGKQDWELFKTQERIAKGKQDDDSVIANVAVGLPPLLRAEKLQKKAAKVNFDWEDINGVIDKLKEEVVELEQAVVNKHDIGHVEEEMGDVLFSLVNVCRHVNVNANIALQQSNKKFEKRFKLMEKFIQEQGETLAMLSEQRLNDYWNQAKQYMAEN